jgi:hypothetical protein
LIGFPEERLNESPRVWRKEIAKISIGMEVQMPRFEIAKNNSKQEICINIHTKQVSPKMSSLKYILN